MLVKGDRVRARWFKAKVVCLSGVQMKLGANVVEVVGTIRHLRGDRPVDPVHVMLYLDPEGEWSGPKEQAHGCTCEGGHVAVKLEHVVEVFKRADGSDPLQP